MPAFDWLQGLQVFDFLLLLASSIVLLLFVFVAKLLWVALQFEFSSLQRQQLYSGTLLY